MPNIFKQKNSNNVDQIQQLLKKKINKLSNYTFKSSSNFSSFKYIIKKGGNYINIFINYLPLVHEYYGATL